MFSAETHTITNGFCLLIWIVIIYKLKKEKRFIYLYETCLITVLTDIPLKETETIEYFKIYIEIDLCMDKMIVLHAYDKSFKTVICQLLLPLQECLLHRFSAMVRNAMVHRYDTECVDVILIKS